MCNLSFALTAVQLTTVQSVIFFIIGRTPSQEEHFQDDIIHDARKVEVREGRATAAHVAWSVCSVMLQTGWRHIIISTVTNLLPSGWCHFTLSPMRNPLTSFLRCGLCPNYFRQSIIYAAAAACEGYAGQVWSGAGRHRHRSQNEPVHSALQRRHEQTDRTIRRRRADQVRVAARFRCISFTLAFRIVSARTRVTTTLCRS